MRETEDGFTLVELVIVVLIVGLLLAIALPTFLSLSRSSRARGAESNVSIALTDEAAFYTQHDSYGTTTSSPGISSLDAGMNWATCTGAGPCLGGTGRDKSVSVEAVSVGPSSSPGVVLGSLGTDGKDYWALESQSSSAQGPLYLVNSSMSPPGVVSFTDRAWPT